MNDKISIRQYLANQASGKELDGNGCYNFFDWFCRDSSLPKKQIELDRRLRAFLKACPELDQDSNYVFYKNNCPMVGGLYDSFSICDMETGEVGFWVTAKSGHKSAGGRAELSGKINGHKENLFEGSWKDLLDFVSKNYDKIYQK